MNKWKNKNKIKQKSHLTDLVKLYKMKKEDFILYYQAKKLLQGAEKISTE